MIFRRILVNKQGEIDSIQGDTNPCSAEKKSSTAVFLDLGSILRRITARNNGRIRSEYGFKFQMGIDHWVFKLFRATSCRITEVSEMQTNPYPVLNPNPKPGFLESFKTQNPYPNPSWKILKYFVLIFAENFNFWDWFQQKTV